MQKIDPDLPEHSAYIAKIRDLARWPHHCILTGTATRDLAFVKLTLLALLEAIRDHLAAKKDIFTLVQEKTGREAYVLLPCDVDGCAEKVCHERR